MKSVVILAIAFLAMASADKVDVVNNNPATVVDNNCDDTVKVANINPNAVNVVDNSDTVKVVEQPQGVNVVDQPQQVDSSFYQPGPGLAGQAPPGYHLPGGLNNPPAEYYNRPIGQGQQIIADPFYSGGGGNANGPQLQQRPANSYKQYSHPGARDGRK